MMKGTDFIISTPKKTLMSLDVGCDIVLICNAPETVHECLSELYFSKSQFANLEHKIQYLIPSDRVQRQSNYLQKIKTKLNRLLDGLV